MADRRSGVWHPGQPERRRGLPDRRRSPQTLQELPTPLPLGEELLPLVSHELRTPIATIQGYADLLGRRLRRRGAEQELLGPVGVINAEVRHLSALVDELIDLSELAQPDTRLLADRVDLAAVVREVAAAVQTQARKHTVVVEAASPLPVRGNVARLRQLIEHLLRNAVKYSPEGSEVRLRSWSAGGTVFLIVADRGMGIAPEHLSRIFEPFFQTEPATRRHFGGLGLGLTLCRAIAERHGGQIWAESTPGEGSTFCVRLPHADAADLNAEGDSGV